MRPTAAGVQSLLPNQGADIGRLGNAAAAGRLADAGCIAARQEVPLFKAAESHAAAVRGLGAGGTAAGAGVAAAHEPVLLAGETAAQDLIGADLGRRRFWSCS